jgi:hypothetical protein
MMAANRESTSGSVVTGDFKTIQRTPSLHGGVVSEPSKVM